MTTRVTQPMMLPGYTTPAMHGAVGDGVADDTAALQAAVDAASVLLLPAGANYFITQRITLHSDLTIFGGGKITTGPSTTFTASDNHLPVLLGITLTNLIIDNIEIDNSAWETTNGAGSARCIHIRRSTHFRVNRCKFTTPGGAVSAVGCKDYEICSNDITCTQPGAEEFGFADGIIDNWVEWDIDSERFLIHGNRIKGGGYAKWGLMVTALTFEGIQMDVLDCILSDNIIEDTFYDGIWVMGRDALLDRITIRGNVISGCRKGVALSDARNFVIEGNVITDMEFAGIELFSEAALGVYIGPKQGIITNNKLHNVAASTDGTPVALYLRLGATDNIVSDNLITGSTQYYGILTDADSIGNVIAGNKIDASRVGGGGRITQLAIGNLIDGATYTATITPQVNITSATLLRSYFVAKERLVTVYFDISVTPSVAATGTELAFSLPIATDIDNSELFGSGAALSSGGCAAVIAYPQTVNDNARIRFFSNDTNVHTVSGSFTYALY